MDLVNLRVIQKELCRPNLTGEACICNGSGGRTNASDHFRSFAISGFRAVLIFDMNPQNEMITYGAPKCRLERFVSEEQSNSCEWLRLGIAERGMIPQYRSLDLHVYRRTRVLANDQRYRMEGSPIFPYRVSDRVVHFWLKRKTKPTAGGAYVAQATNGGSLYASCMRSALEVTPPSDL